MLPKHHNDILDFINHKKKSGKFEIDIPFPDFGRYGISLLRSAYLLLFKEIGYQYILNINTRIIWEWINNYNSNLKPFNGIEDMGNDDRFLGINKISEPYWLKGCFLVVIKIKTTQENINYGILLPGNKNERVDYDKRGSIELVFSPFYNKFDLSKTSL